MKKQDFIFLGRTSKKGSLSSLHFSLKAGTRRHFCGQDSDPLEQQLLNMAAPEHVVCGQSKVRCAISIKYIPDVENLVQQKK